MSESKVYPVKAHISNGALLDKAGYEAMYRASVQDPDAFWGEQGKILDWMKPYTRVKNTSYDPVTSPSNGMKTACSTSLPTVWTAIWPSAATRSPSSGKGTTRKIASSPTASCTPRCASLPTS